LHFFIAQIHGQIFHMQRAIGHDQLIGTPGKLRNLLKKVNAVLYRFRGNLKKKLVLEDIPFRPQ
jgi:hypothetical protein